MIQNPVVFAWKQHYQKGAEQEGGGKNMKILYFKQKRKCKLSDQENSHWESPPPNRSGRLEGGAFLVGILLIENTISNNIIATKIEEIILPGN